MINLDIQNLQLLLSNFFFKEVYERMSVNI